MKLEDLEAIGRDYLLRVSAYISAESREND